MRIALVTALWRRPKLTEAVMTYTKDLAERTGGFVVASITKGDPQYIPEGIITVEAPNEPVAQKFNAAFLKAKEYDPDAVVLFGSDDLLSRDLIEFYQLAYDSEANYIAGLTDLYFYSLQEQEAYHWQGFDPNYHKTMCTIGCGRIFSRYILNRIGWMPYGNLTVNRGLDANSMMYLKGRKWNVSELGYTMREAGSAIDIKHEVNLNDYNSMKYNHVHVNYQEIFRTFGDVFQSIDSLRIDMSHFPKGKVNTYRLLREELSGIKLGKVGQLIKLEGTTALGLYRNGLIEIP